MRGYDVVTSDDRIVGRVMDVRHGFLIVESGRLRKTRHPVPREFVHVVDEAAKAFVTVPRRILMDAPKADKNGEFDTSAAARHFGLAESYLQPPAAGEGIGIDRLLMMFANQPSIRETILFPLLRPEGGR